MAQYDLLVTFNGTSFDLPVLLATFPDLPLDQEWTDAKLYERYGLTTEEIAFIELQIAEHADAMPDEVLSDEDADE